MKKVSLFIQNYRKLGIITRSFFLHALYYYPRLRRPNSHYYPLCISTRSVFLPALYFYPLCIYKICGQTKCAKPEDIQCLKPGSHAQDAFDEISQLWDKSPEDLPKPQTKFTDED